MAPPWCGLKLNAHRAEAFEREAVSK